MSWTRRIRHPREMLAKGDDVEVVILAIDKDIRRISLGVKQLTPDPWLELSTKYGEGTFVEAKVVRPLERGVVVEVEDGVEGFIPVSHLGDRNIKQPELHFGEDDIIPAKVIKVDHEGRRIVLSVGDRLREEGGDAHKEFMDKYGKPRFSPREKKPDEEGLEIDDSDLVGPIEEAPEAPEGEA